MISESKSGGRGKIIGEILKVFLAGGAIAIAMTSPYFLTNILFKKCWKKSHGSAKEKKKFYNAFYHLRKNGFLEIERKNKQIHISLTEEGKKRAGRYQLNEMEIKKPANWDKKWRIIIFDVPDKYRIKRETLRGKLKELGFMQLQKSVWLHPYSLFSMIV